MLVTKIKLGVKPVGGKNHCGERRKCFSPRFSPLSTLFSKAHFLQGGTKTEEFVLKS